nr:PREDICTED: sushi domain-containing protein 1 [Latimeria chalumnae]|eukprot:XP_014342431.1 PREDICTED: sushi domain-containing protein 1 [Latimeria chalumnae]
MTGSWVTFLGFITISLVAFHSNALSKVAHVCTTCHANATCQNKSDGKPTCICNYGFVGNGRTFCQDKDECQIGTEKICGNHTACHNTHGGFYCTCLKGYHPSNDMTTFIPNDGTYCAAVDCGTPSTLSSSVVHLRKSTTFGSKVTYTCKEGFIHKSGNDTSVCSADGLWVGADLVCEAVDCGIPPNISNTLMHFAGNATYRSKVVYQCQPGYTGENMSSVCTAAGWWESSGLVCKAVDCGIPPNISNALTHFAGISTFGNKVVYQCQPGYTGGNKSSVCTAAGRWENVSLVCEAVDCGIPPNISNALTHFAGISTFGNKVVYQCQPGYTGGNKSSVCTAAGRWENVSLVCEAVNCGIPPNVLNAQMHFTGETTYGNKVVYQCQPGYLERNESSVCTAAGQWERVQMACRAVDCGIPPNISNALIRFVGNSTYGNKVVYQCQLGYTGGNISSVCTAAGQWERVSLVCKAVDCETPPNISNALMHFAGNTTYGSKVVYQCLPGYVGGNVSLVCTAAGQWERDRMACKVVLQNSIQVTMRHQKALSTAVDCGIPPNISNALMHFAGNTTYGSKIVYQCQPGYFGGNESSLCTAAGQWERVSLACKEVDCGSPPLILHADILWNGATGLGSTAHYKCLPGFHTVRGKNISVCALNGEWENVTLVCKEVDCGKPPLIPHIDILWNGTTGLGSVAHYKCEPGFHRLRGRTFSFCMLNGQWEDITLVCKEINCGCPPVIEHADLVWDNTSRVGSVVYYRCKEEFMKVGGKTFSVCTEGGVWEKGTLICEVPTPTVSAEITTSASAEDISDVSVFNESCLKWRRSTGWRGLERTYLFQIEGRRPYQKEFYHEAMFNFTTKEGSPELCLNLQPGTNYTVNITALPTGLSALITVTTEIAEPEMVDVQFIATEGQLQPLILRRAEDKNGPISLYQVVVFPLCPQCVFDCSLLSTQGFYNSSTDTGGYVAAEFRAEVIVGKLTFSIGDRQYYGEFYNAPLERGKDYYIILRTISEWNMVGLLLLTGLRCFDSVEKY